MSYINLEDEDLINADEEELRVEEDGLLPSDNEDNDNNVGNADAGDPNTTSNAVAKAESKKRVVKNPQPKLNPDRLRGPKGLIVLESWFKDIQLKGKGHEKEDLDAVLSRLEQWTHQLFPKYTFDDMLKKIESLGHKNQIQYYVKKIRMGEEDDIMMPTTDDVPNDDEPPPEPNTDPFDTLFDNNPSDRMHTQSQATQSQAPQTQQSTLTEEQRQRIVRNRLIAEERRLARMNARQEELSRQQQEQARDELSQVEAAAMEIDGL